GCGAKQPPAGGSHGPKAEAAKRAAIDAAMGGAAAGAEAHSRVVAKAPRPAAPAVPATAVIATQAPPADPPRPADRAPSEAVIRERVASARPHVSEADADADALEQVQRRIADRLAALDPPVRAVPTVDYIKRHYQRRNGRTVRPLDPRAREHLAGLPGVTANQ